MPTTTFRPQLDSLVIEQDLPLDPITKERIRELISQTIPKTISTLRPSYGALLDEYCDPKRLLNGVGGETPGYYGQSTMLAFAALDYFNSKLAYKPSPGLTSQQGVKQRAFFANRLLAAADGLCRAADCRRCDRECLPFCCIPFRRTGFPNRC